MPADFVWAVMTIFDSSGASTTPCAGDSNIWIFCLVAVIVMPIAGCVVNMLSSMADSAGVVIQVRRLHIRNKNKPLSFCRDERGKE